MAIERNNPTWISDIIEAVKAQLVAEHVYDQEMVFCALDDAILDIPPGDQFATILPGPQRPDNRVVAGGGLVVVPFEGLLGVTCRCRLAVDQAHRDDQFLTDITLGAFERARLVIAALEMFDPYTTVKDYAVGQTIIGATNATPIVITTSSAHGYASGWIATIVEVGGNTNANVTNATILVLSPTTFSIVGAVGNGNYTTGGMVRAAPYADGVMAIHDLTLLADPMRLADSGFYPIARNPSDWGGVLCPFEIKWLANMTKNTLS